MSNVDRHRLLTQGVEAFMNAHHPIPAMVEVVGEMVDAVGLLLVRIATNAKRVFTEGQANTTLDESV